MLKLGLYHILLLLIAVFFQCASSTNNEQHTFSPIYTSTETVSTPEESNHYNDCTTNFSTLERALFFTDNNRFELISAFYPARESATLFLNVKYNFSIPENDQTELTVCHNWIWTTGTFYLIESPDVFLFTSLLFVHPENKIHTLTLRLPADCAGVAQKCASNPNKVSMLEILTRRLKLYSQYNNLEHVEVPDDTAYAVKAIPVLDINDIYYKHVNTYFSFTIVFPIPIIIMLTVVCFKGARLQLRVKLNHPSYFPSFASLATMGMLFSFFVISLDICALFWAFGKHINETDNELEQSGLNSTIESHNIAIGTLVVDVAATVLSCIIFVVGLLLECGLFCCNQNVDKCVNVCFQVWLWPIFCYSSPKSRSKEKMNWILAATCIAPIICFGSHISFVVLAWLADPKHAGAVSVIYIFMFFYYYVTLKAFYQLLIDGRTGCLTCCRNAEVAQNRCCSCCCNCLLKFPRINNGKIKHQLLYDMNDLESPEKEIEDYEKVIPDTHISFWAILMTGIFGMLLASLQVYSITSLVLLPLIGVIEDTPNYILSLFQVAVFFLTAVITYAILTAEEPVERELVKSVVRNFYYYFQKFRTPAAEEPPPAEEEPPPVPAEVQSHKPARADVVQKVGNIVGALAYKQLSSHVVIKMVADDDSDADLLRPCTPPPV